MKQHKLIVDFDETIAINTTPGDEHNIFEYAWPNKALIEKLNYYKNNGYSIVIYTSRGMLSCNNDAEKAKQKYKKVMVEWLNRNNVIFDEIIFGKPFGDLYIDDKAITPEDFIKM